jgi:hypothetical protein
MTEQERRYLIEAYRAEVLQLQELLDWDCRNWLIDDVESLPVTEHPA